jgi:hypothetical protein
MNRFRTMMAISAAVAATAFAGMSVASPAGAAADPFVGMQVLDLMCASNEGTPVNSPYAIGRCQAARTKKGFEIEQLVCEGLLEGHFISAPSFDRPNRTSWSCIAGQPAA